MKNKRGVNDKPAGRPTKHSANPAQRLLDGLYRQRGELGDVANDLISRFRAAGISIPARNMARIKKF